MNKKQQLWRFLLAACLLLPAAIHAQALKKGSFPAGSLAGATPVAVKAAYWSSNQESKIFKSTMGGSGAQIETLYDGDDGVAGPKGIALDKANNLIYWANSGTKSIMRAPLDGNGPVETIFTSSNGINLPQDIVIDLATNTIYIANLKSAKLYCISKGDLNNPGSNLENIYTVPTTDSKAYAAGIDLDGTNLYWTEAYSGRTMKGSIHADGSADPEVLFDAGAAPARPDGLAVDSSPGKIYIKLRIN